MTKKENNYRKEVINNKKLKEKIELNLVTFKDGMVSKSDFAAEIINNVVSAKELGNQTMKYAGYILITWLIIALIAILTNYA